MGPSAKKKGKKRHNSTPKKQVDDHKKLKPTNIEQYFPQEKSNNSMDKEKSNNSMDNTSIRSEDSSGMNINSNNAIITENETDNVSPKKTQDISAKMLAEILEKVQLIPEMNTNLISLKTDLAEVKHKVNRNTVMIQKASDVQKINDEKFKVLETKIAELEKDACKNEIDKQVVQIQTGELNKKIAELEYFSRRDNLIFYGIKETEDENVISKIYTILTDYFDIVDAETRIKFVRVHRLGKHLRKMTNAKPRPVLVRFHYHPDAIEVYRKRNYNVQLTAQDPSIGQNRISISLDFTDEMKQVRYQLKKVLSLATKIDSEAHLRQDKLMFQGKLHSLEECYHLQLPIHEIGTKTSENQVLFFGRFSIYSNFYPSSFETHGLKFTCNEHYYQFRRAQITGDNLLAVKILHAKDPINMKKLGDQVDKSKWLQSIAVETMKLGLFEKFNQNPQLQQALIDTNDKNIFECNSNDQLWGTGTRLSDPLASQGKGNNLLGKCLEEIRKFFIAKQSGEG